MPFLFTKPLHQYILDLEITGADDSVADPIPPEERKTIEDYKRLRKSKLADAFDAVYPQESQEIATFIVMYEESATAIFSGLRINYLRDDYPLFQKAVIKWQAFLEKHERANSGVFEKMPA